MNLIVPSSVGERVRAGIGGASVGAGLIVRAACVGTAVGVWVKIIVELGVRDLKVGAGSEVGVNSDLGGVVGESTVLAGVGVEGNGLLVQALRPRRNTTARTSGQVLSSQRTL